MLKRLLLLTAAIAAEALFADAVAVGKSRNGYPLIVPQVQKLTPAAGGFVLPAELTVAAPEELDLAPLARIYAQTVPGGALERSKKDPACRFELVGDGVPKSPEGYALKIDVRGIAVKARDLRGLYYGMQTVAWMLRNRADAATLRCCAVTDWPDLEMRGIFLQLHSVTSKQTDRLCHVIDTLGALKYNTLLLAFYDNFPFREDPFPGRKDPLTMADVRKILAAAKRNHMEVIPYVQLISHTQWMKNHRDWDKLKEPDTKDFNYCLSNPEITPLVERLVRELADEMKPRYFHIGLDEIENRGFPKCPKCKAADPKSMMSAHLRPVLKMFTRRNITPIIYQDPFFGNGEPQLPGKLKIRDFPEKLARKLMINSWEYWHYPSDEIAKRIRKRGFKDLLYMSWAIAIDNCQNLPKVAFRTGSHGNILAYWSMVPMTLDKPERPLPGFYPSTVAQANYSWNVNDAEFSSIPADSALVLRELLDGPPEWIFRGEAAQLPLDGALNRAFSGDPVFPAFDARTMEEMKKIAAADRAKFDLKVGDGAPLAIVLSGSKYDGFAAGPVKIPVGTKATGASFLMTAALFNQFVYTTSVYSLKRFDIGMLRVVYADGRSEKIPLTYLGNINDWNTCIGGNSCRAVLRGNDRNGALFSLYAIDWRNPRPDEEIKEIVMTSNSDTFISPVLFAVSLSDAEKAPAGAAGKPKIAAPAERANFKFTPAVSFKAGLPKGTKGTGEGTRGFKYRAVDDPEGGKVLEISMRESHSYLARPLVDMPVKAPQDFGSVVFALKIGTPRAVFRPDFYLMNRRGSKLISAAGLFIDTDDSWHTICIPRERFKGTEVAPDKAEAMSIRFFMHRWEKPISIRVGDISYCDGILPSRINVKNPVK